MTRMSQAYARRVIGASTAGPPFGHTSKMPGFSYGLDAYQCKRGGRLSQITGTICNAHCYAKRNFYATWGAVIKNRERHQEAIGHPEWEDAIVLLMARFVRPDGTGPQYFRWLDSGDLPDEVFLGKVANVARRTPWVRHWLPTREYEYVARFLAVASIPGNLVVRLSADDVGARPAVPPALGLGHLPTSTVHRSGQLHVQVSGERKDSIECRAWTREHQCGPCRACWSPDVRNVSYPLTGETGPAVRRPAALRVLQ